MKHLFNHKLKVVFIIALVMMTASCSFKTLYNQLDNLIPFYVEGMVSLDSMLEEKVAQRSLLLIRWHRNTQLNQYAEWLRVLQRDTNNQLTEEKILKHIATLESFWKSIALKVDEEMVSLLPLLNTEQRKELFSNIEDKNAEFREEYAELEGDERIEQYTDRIIDSFETWLGDLTDKQEILAKQAAAKLQSTALQRLERRQQWQQSIQRILDTGSRVADKVASLRKYFTDYNRKNNVDMNASLKENINIISRLTLQMVHSMTDEQKAHFVTSTNDYIRIFDELAKER